MKLEDIQTQREKFAKGAYPFVSERRSDHNAYGAYLFEGGHLYTVGRYACHGFLSNYSVDAVRDSNRKQGKIEYLLSAVMSPHENVSKEDLLGYIYWLTNDSPWQNNFVDKDASRIIQLGHVVDANNPTSFIASGMIASRFPTEVYSGDVFPLRFRVYKELLEIGCNRNEAFFFAHMFAPSGIKKLYPITFSRLSSGHSTFYSTNYQENYVRNFLTGKVVHVGKNILANGNGYETGSLNKTWGETTDKDSFAEAVKQLVPKRAQKKVDYHIFRKAPASGYSYADRDDFASIIEQLRGMINA